MKAHSRTNLIRGHLSVIANQIDHENSPMNIASLEASFTLLFEQALCALIDESAPIEQPNLDCHGLEGLLHTLEVNANSWSAQVIRNGLSDESHWLYLWQQRRVRWLDNQPSSSTKAQNPSLIAIQNTDQQSNVIDFKVLLEYFDSLVSNCRDYNIQN